MIVRANEIYLIATTRCTRCTTRCTTRGTARGTGKYAGYINTRGARGTARHTAGRTTRQVWATRRAARHIGFCGFYLLFASQKILSTLTKTDEILFTCNHDNDFFITHIP